MHGASHLPRVDRCAGRMHTNCLSSRGVRMSFDVRVCSYELRDERGGWQVADGLAVAEKLIPFLFPEGVALALGFGEEGLTPEVDFWGVSKRQSIWYVSSKPSCLRAMHIAVLGISLWSRTHDYGLGCCNSCQQQ